MAPAPLPRVFQGIFGLNLYIKNASRLINKGILNLVLCLDNDERGIKATEKIMNKYKNIFNITSITPLIEGKDIAETSQDQMIKIKNYINGVSF